MVRLTDRPAMTIAVDLGGKATKQTNIGQYIKTIFSVKLFYISVLIICFGCSHLGQQGSKTCHLSVP